MTLHERIAEYFRVLPPKEKSEKDLRDADWAIEHQSEIQGELERRGPGIWYSRIEVVKASGIFTHPNAVDDTAELFYRSFGLGPNDLLGKRILDVGAFSGGMSYFAEDCGAEVVALDIQNPETNGFGVIHDVRRSTVTHVTASIYDIHPELFGSFDVIVFSGVHYHLKHPLLAMERLSAVTKMGGELLALGAAADYWLHKPGAETAGVNLASINGPDFKGKEVDNLNEIPILGFYKNAYMQDESNWFVPNTLALADMIAASGYDIALKATYPIHQRLINGPTACALVKATKVGEPKPEYSVDVYAHVRRLSGTETPSSTFSIPTWYELARERRDRAGVTRADF
jgi:tRNA (mo5U34)-methyltransferase